MLTELRIRDLGVIADVTLPLGPGLTVLSGETGAGKTMVVSALELVIGGRADTERVRRGARAAVVEAFLSPAPPGAGEWAEDLDAAEEFTVVREVAAEGRSRSRLGGRAAPVAALAQVVGAVVELHGQSDSARLSTAPVQRELLDRSGGPALAAAAERYTSVYARWRAAGDELEALLGGERDRLREADRLAFELGEIDAVAPEAGEEERLDAELRRLEHAEALVAAATTAADALAEDGGARDALGAGVAALRAVAGVDETLEPHLARVEGLAAEAQDLAFELRAYVSALELDPEGLEHRRGRRAALAGLTRKYGPDTAAVTAYADRARARLSALTSSDDRRAALAAEVGQLADEVAGRGADLTTERGSAGERLSASVGGHLAELAMADARMSVGLEPVGPGPTGCDRVSFTLAANVGEPALPLRRAASGGERSRVALAVRLALVDSDRTPVLVFDEVDAGVGGEVALAVGRKLARLARGRQVLCVTHLAQLAAFADAHLVVTKVVMKGADDGRTVAAVRSVEGVDRVVELSRMLSGTPEAGAARRHAEQLLALARGTGG